VFGERIRGAEVLLFLITKRELIFRAVVLLN